MFHHYSGFSRYIYFATVGLGFRRKRKFIHGRRVFWTYLAGRHRTGVGLDGTKLLMMVSRNSNLILFGGKNIIMQILSLLRNFRKDSYFKLKGIFLKRTRIRKIVAKTWAYARRARFKKLKLKLSKKQKFI